MEAALASLGVDEETLLIIISDHGEEFLEHGRLGHRFTLYQELLHVPFVIRLPGRARAGTVIDTPVSILDLVPTVLDLIGEPIPDGLSGVSLKPLIEGGTIPPRPLYAEVKNRTGETKSITEYPWKLIFTIEDDVVELYDLDADPGELNDLSDSEPDRVTEMRTRLEAWFEDAEPRWDTEQAPPLSEEEMKRLQEMGYIQ
jgi:arylsulfatase A-like enzyme